MSSRVIISSLFAVAIGTGVLPPTNGQLKAGIEEVSSASEIVPLYVSVSRPLAMLTLGDGPPSPVAFDTGTNQNILQLGYAKRIGLTPVGTTEITDGASGKATTVPTATLVDSSLGGVEVDAGNVPLLDYRRPNEVGVFGPNSFGDRLVILEAGLNRIRLVPRTSGLTLVGPGTAYDQGLPVAFITVNGMRLAAHVDSGNDDQLILGGGLLRKVRLKEPARVVGVARSALGEQEVLGGQLDGEVQIGPARVRDPEVTFSGAGQGANIGFAMLRKLTIVLDPANKRSWVLDPTSGPGPLSAFVGSFGVRRVYAKGNSLIYKREGRPAVQLAFLGSDLFENATTGDRFQFYRKGKRVVKLELISADGQVTPADRTS